MKTSYVAGFIILALWASYAQAAISPARIKAMRAECGEMLEVKITSVVEGATTTRGPATRTDITYRATVVKASRSKSGLKPGDVIEIKSYIAGGVIEPGPLAPSRLKADWRGVVYLNHVEEQQYKIAVFGHSFVEGEQE